MRNQVPINNIKDKSTRGFSKSKALFAKTKIFGCPEGNVKKLYIATLVFVIIIQGFSVQGISAQGQTASTATTNAVATSTSSASTVDQIGSYSQYMINQSKNQIDSSAKEIIIPMDSFIKKESKDCLLSSEYKGFTGNIATTTDSGVLTFPVQVQNSAFYQIKVEYFPVEGDGGIIVRTLSLDGTVPYQEANGIEFSRTWIDETKVGALKDKLGNDIRPKQIEKPEWNNTFLFDPSGFHSSPLLIYLSKGDHKITLTSQMESLAIRKITLIPNNETKSYDEIKTAQDAVNADNNPETIIIQGEEASAKSDQTLYPMQDRSSPDVVPYDVNLQRFNTIGGERWKTVGQWIEWTVDVPDDAFYTLALRWKQDIKMNDVSVRECWIDGALPFKEASNLLFDYNGGWQISKLSDSDSGVPYRFYFTKGPHTIRLKVGLGEYAAIAEKAQSLLFDLNKIYRQIVTITGPQPDQYRDYQFKITIPSTIETMKEVQKNISEMESTINSMTGGGGQNTAVLSKLSFQINGMTSDVETIAYRLIDFQNNISSFGSWINQIKEQPLEIDYLMLSAGNSVLPRAEAPVYSVVWHYLKQFIASFTTDYTEIGMMDGQTQEDITVWIGSGMGTTAGRDQSQLIRQLINEYYTPSHKTTVQLQLVSMGSLLPATLAGIGPDVALQQSQADPLNYALRNAVVDLASFPDVKTVEDRFYQSALDPFILGGHLYAIPETQSYPMLFFRKDILDELGISLDLLDDWDSLLLTVLPKIQKSYLQFGLLANINSYAMLLYQENGSFYEQDNQKSGLDSIQGIAAFEKFTSIYTEYKQLLAFDFANRFRTGEMPIAINDFTAYNQLSVFAPEMKGLWGMRPVPGVRQADGTINRTVASSVSGGIILANSKNRNEAWDFLKWWTQDDTQAMYGKELESIMGAAARYPTANIKAMEKMQWEKEIKANLKIQQLQTKAIPEVPGGYFTPRHFDFAFRNVVLSGKDVRETIIKAARNISDEIINKRKEFNLPISQVTP